MDGVALYRESFVWDGHCGFELQPDAALGPLLQPWIHAGVHHLSVNVAYDPQPWSEALLNIASLRRRIPTEVPDCQIISSVSDIDRARAAGKLAISFDIEGMNSLNGRIDLVGLYYLLGVRQMLFAYNRNNLAGSGCHDEDIGLTPFGRRVIDEMNRVGMVVDCSHSGVNTTMAAMERSTDPVIFSHSNAKALAEHERNMTDQQIRACAETGGVMGINGVSLFLGETYASPTAVARHAAYVAELTGPEHVGLSMDYSPDLVGGGGTDGSALMRMFAASPYYWPKSNGYESVVSCLDVRHLPEVAEALITVGFNREEITGILGGNFRRIAERVWK